MSAATLISEWRKKPVKFVHDNFKIEPDAWQIQALEALGSSDPNKSRISLQACAGPGKGNRSDDSCLTPLGFKKYSELHAGDFVFGEDGAKTKIIGVRNWGVRKFYRVHFCDGSFDDVSDKHVWKVKATNNYKRFKDWSLVETEELSKLSLSALRVTGGRSFTSRFFKIPKNHPVQFQEKKFLVHPYCLGLWLGDGCRKTSLIVKDDYEPFDYLRSIGLTVVDAEKKGGGDSHTVHGLLTALKKLGIANLYSGGRFIPDEYFLGSVKQRKDLLSGLLDTDSRIKNNGMLDFHSTSKQLIHDVAMLARSLGCYAHMNRAEDNHRNSTCYAVSLRCNFNPYKIRRKAERWRMPPENRLQKHITKIEPIGKNECVCIEVEDANGCYQTKNYNVTHNSAVLAWIALWFLVCWASKGEHPKGAAVAVTRDNLRDNLWPEISKWQNRSEFLRHAFEWTKERLTAKDHPETWFISARSWSKTADEEEQGRTLSGLHSKYVLYLIDESGDIPIAVLKAAEQGLSNCDWGKIIQAGNPTSLEGMLYAAATTLREKWHVISITGDPDDPMRSPRIDKEWAQDQINEYGRSDPWVMSYILGKFPPASINALLSLEDVEAAMKRNLTEDKFSFAQKRLGVDVARFGMDANVIFPRQGLFAGRPVELRGARSEEIAARVMMAKGKWGSEVEFVDGTGGYGAGAIDAMLQGGGNPMEINFAGKATDPRYFNKRSEIYFLLAGWVKRGGHLPDIPQLRKELPSVTYTYQAGKFRIEEKEQIKKRLGFSPDYSDALALTFSLPEMPATSAIELKKQQLSQGKMAYEYDPFAPGRV